jgi:hypothetical protein
MNQIEVAIGAILHGSVPDGMSADGVSISDIPDYANPLARALRLTNKFTREVLAEAIDLTLPTPWTATMSADSDIVLGHDPAGHWAGIRMKGLEHHKRKWWVWRGSLFQVERAPDEQIMATTLQGVCDQIIHAGLPD